MAEALAIVGSVAAILQLSEFAFKVVSTAYDIHNSISGLTTANEGVEDTTFQLGGLLRTLQAQTASTSNTRVEQDAGLSSLAKNCASLGQKLLEQLNKTKTKNSNSFRENLKASVKTVWKKDDIKDLKRQLDSCVTQLGVHLVATFRCETGEKLEKVLSSNSAQTMEIALLRQVLDRIEHDGKLAVKDLGLLRDIFSPSEKMFHRINQDRILKAVGFEGMGNRYHEVASSATDTFTWCLEDLQVPDSHPDLNLSFRQWLSKGNGIYHISGKPGAGKSTLMKLIVENDNTKEYLLEWADGRSLVVANFFVWKPGTPLQKSLEGLVRSIVHSILTAAPEMIPLIFSTYWDPRGESQWQATTDLEIPSCEIYAAFEKLTENCGIMKDYRFCFFTDGLDEFQDTSENHTNIAQLFKAWTDQSLKTVKICVSSREENPFMNNFHVSQRLRLHLLTQADMRKSVEKSLGQHPNFVLNSLEDRQEFIEALVTRAEGVFLWTKLVLHKLGGYLDVSGALCKLHAVLEHVPRELKGVFSEMLDSIQPEDQEEAWAVLAVLMAANQHDLG